MNSMIDEFTSTGKKFFHHREALEGLRTNKPRPVVAHVMPTDVCQHTCAFCSVQTREGDKLEIKQITTFLDQLVPLGLKAVIVSGGGNPILYPHFNEMIAEIHNRGLQIGLITNGMPLKTYYFMGWKGAKEPYTRQSWKNVTPATLDKLTWIRISMSGFDHPENAIYVPEIDPAKTTLGFSYVYHDAYEVPDEPHHGKVSTPSDLVQLGMKATNVRYADSRYEEIRDKIRTAISIHNPRYVRLLPNCLEPEKIAARCATLRQMAREIDPSRVFVQYKPPEAPEACYLGYLHPVLNTDGYVYPCDSCVLNRAAGHKFASPWRIARWDNVSDIYNRPVTSLVDSEKLCPGCVFTGSNALLADIKAGLPIPAAEPVEHPNFV